MAITVECKSCGTQFKAKEEWVGKRAKCTYCGHIIIIRKVYGPAAKQNKRPSPKAPPAREPQSPKASRPAAEDAEKKETLSEQRGIETSPVDKKKEEFKVREEKAPLTQAHATRTVSLTR